MKSLRTFLALAILLTSQPLANATSPVPLQEQLEEEIKLSKIKYNDTNYNVIKIPKNRLINEDLEIKIAHSVGERKSLESLSSGAIAAINGNFYDENDKPIGYLKDSKVINGEHINRKNKGFFVVNKGLPDIIRTLGDYHYDVILESYPLLVYDYGAMRRINNESDFRSAVAIDKSHNLYLVTTENGTLSAGRITYKEFQDFLISQNYKTALNLDGGTSTQMLKRPGFNQHGLKGIVTAIGIYPSRL